MTATIEFSDDARRKLDDADKRRVAEHGYFASSVLRSFSLVPPRANAVRRV
jgi:hypothetical protein